MKRVVLFSSFLLVGFSAFAYGGSDSVSNFLLIIYIVLGIFSIILFFKVWRMTDDVALLKKEIEDIRDSVVSNGVMSSDNIPKIEIIRKTIKQLYFTGNSDEAYDILNKYTFKRIEWNSSLWINKNGETHFVDELGKEYVFLNKNGGWEKTYNYREALKQRYDVIIDMVTPLYKAIGREIPETLKTITYDKLNDFGK
ncbi:MAG: hypothetical protein IK120_03395 [Muribaculaceae bacterium]|nr:hypothetical protein [Muribaculaceae bacterium]